MHTWVLSPDSMVLGTARAPLAQGRRCPGWVATQPPVRTPPYGSLFHLRKNAITRLPHSGWTGQAPPARPLRDPPLRGPGPFAGRCSATHTGRLPSRCLDTKALRRRIIAASIYDRYSVCLYIRSISTRCCLTMTNRIQVCSNFR